MKFLHELLDFARRDSQVFITILKWLVTGIFLITLMTAFDFFRPWVTG